MRRSRKRAPRPICTYEVDYQFFTSEFVELHARLRCPRLLRVQMAEHKTLVGEVSRKQNGKWSAFGQGSLPGCAEYTTRFIREVIDTPPAMAVVQGGK